MSKTIKLNAVRFCLNVLAFHCSARVIFVANNFVCQTPADRFLEQTTDRPPIPVLIFDFHRSTSHAHNAYGNKERA